MLRAFYWRQLTIFANMACLSGSVMASSVAPGCAGPAESTTTNDITDTDCVRLSEVTGDADKTNDILFCGNLATGKEHVVYFGGDVQDFRDNMLAHRDNHRHVRWCLEETAKLLHKRFPEGNVWIVKPSAMYIKTLSVFCNFVKTNGVGTPTFSDNYRSMRHLEALLSNAIMRVRETQGSRSQGKFEEHQSDKYSAPVEHGPSETDSDCSNNIEGRGNVADNGADFLPIRLIGFSKGSVVLNQMLHELHLIDTDEPIRKAFSQIKAFYWLDGGHAGKTGTWITDVKILQHLSKLSAELYIHVTPYQMDDSNRPWIAKEEKKFVSKLRSLGLKVTETKHFEDDIRSIEIHFRILEAF